MKYVKTVINKLQEAGLVINLDKSVFGKTEVRYLGFVVNGEGLKPDPEKVRPIIDYPAPKNLKQLRCYLGLCRFYRKFIRDYAKIVEPFNHLLRSRVKYEWEGKSTEGFCQVKETNYLQSCVIPT